MLVSSIDPVFSDYRSSRGNGRKNRFRVRLEDGADFILYKKELDRFHICQGEDIPEDLYSEILQDIFIPRARSRALHLLVSQDRNEADLRKKLRDSGYPPEAIDAAVSYVMDYGYIDDVRFTQSFIRSHRDRHSRKRILFDLDKKGISRHTIETAISLMEEEYDSPVFDDISIINKRISPKRDQLSDEHARKKIYANLMRAGFSGEDISTAFRDL